MRGFQLENPLLLRRRRRAGGGGVGGRRGRRRRRRRARRGRRRHRHRRVGGGGARGGGGGGGGGGAPRRRPSRRFASAGRGVAVVDEDVVAVVEPRVHTRRRAAVGRRRVVRGEAVLARHLELLVALDHRGRLVLLLPPLEAVAPEVARRRLRVEPAASRSAAAASALLHRHAEPPARVRQHVEHLVVRQPPLLRGGAHVGQRLEAARARRHALRRARPRRRRLGRRRAQRVERALDVHHLEVGVEQKLLEAVAIAVAPAGRVVARGSREGAAAAAEPEVHREGRRRGGDAGCSRVAQAPQKAQASGREAQRAIHSSGR